MALAGMQALYPGGTVLLLGRSERVVPSAAALLGALSSTAQTFDDTHFATTAHPTGPVAAALLAVAHVLAGEGQPVAGSQLLAALAVGMEIECRVSCAITANGGHPGWFITGLSGGIGAAAAVGRLLRLTRRQQSDAMGLAAMQASGCRASHGSMAMTCIPGFAAQSGLMSAYMARAGFTASEGSIDGHNGLLQVLTGQADIQTIEAELGERFEFLNNAYKPFPCGFVIHASLDACMHILGKAKISSDRIERIELRVHPKALSLCWRKLPTNVFAAQVSLFHWVAAAFVRGAAGVAEGELECIMDPRVRALQERSHATADPELTENQAGIAVHLCDGEVIEHFTENAIGSQTHPMTDLQLQEKFQGLVGPVLGKRRTQDLLDACWSLPGISDSAHLLVLGAI